MPGLRLPSIMPAVALSCALVQMGLGAAAGAQEPGLFVFSRAQAGTYWQPGEDETRVCLAQGDHVRPRLVPGTNRIVLNSNRGPRPGIWFASVDGGLGERLCDGDQVAVSADGRFLAFRRDGAIVQRELASGAEVVLSPAEWVRCSCPSFCPDGRVLFVSEDAGKTTVCRADPQKLGTAETLFAAEAKSTPRCSPDGQTIACQDGAHISLFDARAGSHRRLTFAAGVQSWPMWSRDGRSLAYLQSPGPLDGPWHVYRVPLDDPKHVTMILRDVEVSPDWNGLGFTGGDASEVAGGSARLWRTGQPLPASAEAAILPSPAAGWTEASGKTSGDVMVGCEWGGLYVSADTGKLLLGQKQADGVAATAELRLLDAQGREAQRITAIDVSAPAADTVSLGATFALPDGASVAATITVSRTWPFVQVQPADREAGLLVRRALAVAVVPDRLAHDLVYEPSDHTQPSVPLPRAPFMLGMSAGKPGLLMVATPSTGQTTELAKGADAQSFGGVRVQCDGQAALVSFLPGDDLCRHLDVARAEEGPGWEVVWSNPFPALWRAAVPVPESALSLMVPTDTPNTEQRVALDEARRLTNAPPQAIAYAYGPSENAPLDRAMPVDILHEAIGLDRTAALLDTVGIRTCRHADEWVPYKDPRVALKMISWLRQRKRPGVQERIEGLCHDITLSLQGLDVRLQEYESFVGEARGLAAVPNMPADLSAWMRPQLSALDAALGERAVTPLPDVTARIEAFRTNVEARYDPFAAPVTRALAEREAHLSAYRSFAKALRDKAGRTLVQSPDSRQACEALRDLCGHALRQRYYLEDDWLGEEPLGGPEVSYDQIKDW